MLRKTEDIVENRGVMLFMDTDKGIENLGIAENQG